MHEAALRRPNYARPARAPRTRLQQKDDVADAPNGFWRLRFLATSYAQVLAVRGMEENHLRTNGQVMAERDAGLRRLQGWFGELLDLTQRTEQEVRLELVREYRRVAPPEVRAWQQATPRHRRARPGPAAWPRRSPGPRGPLPLGGRGPDAPAGRWRAVRPERPSAVGLLRARVGGGTGGLGS
jgi:hypothetical protein